MAGLEPPPRNEGRAAVPGIGALLSAIRDLTLFGGGGRNPAADSAVYYPVVGLLLGALWLAADRLAEPAGRVPSSLAVLAVAVLSTGGRPLLCAGLLLRAALSPARKTAVAVLESSPAPSACVGAALVAGLELLCLSELDRFRAVGLVFAPMLGRLGMVVLLVGSRRATSDGRQIKLAPGLGFNEFALASTFSFAVVFLATDFLGLLLVLTAAAFTVGLRVLFHRWIGGVNEAVVGASCEITQLLTLALLTALR